MNELAQPRSALPSAIRCEGLTVTFGKNRALEDLSFDFRGRSLGLLGPNGAGKSTLIKCLMGLIRPTRGSAEVLGYASIKDRIALRRNVGYVPERDCHIPGMSAIDYATLGGELTGMPRSDAIQRAHEMLHFCGLGEARYRPVDGYSAGMKQRIKLAQALVHDPKLIFLDEPTNGLDPEGRVALLSILRDLQTHKGIRIILSSHLLRDVEFVCEEVVVVRKGRLLKHASMSELKRISECHWRIRIRGDLAGFIEDARVAGCELTPAGRDAMDVVTPLDGDGSQLILQIAAHRGCQVRELAARERDLQDAFLEAIQGD
ncbi:MAG: ABC transporter ATP-binding protein [Planctomycetes bacterium]|nr:ABC transporter ATP-binding protein [Planctomycetota bacterium]